MCGCGCGYVWVLFCSDNCVGVLVISVLVFTVFFIVSFMYVCSFLFVTIVRNVATV